MAVSFLAPTPATELVGDNIQPNTSVGNLLKATDARSFYLPFLVRSELLVVESAQESAVNPERVVLTGLLAVAHPPRSRCAP